MLHSTIFCYHLRHHIHICTRRLYVWCFSSMALMTYIGVQKAKYIKGKQKSKDNGNLSPPTCIRHVDDVDYIEMYALLPYGGEACIYIGIPTTITITITIKCMNICMMHVLDHVSGIKYKNRNIASTWHMTVSLCCDCEFAYFSFRLHSFAQFCYLFDIHV